LDDLTERLDQQWAILDDNDATIWSRCFWSGLNKPPTDQTQAYLQQSDWIVSLEVLEHVPSYKEPTVVENILKLSKNGIILSWAVPKQGGVSYINEKTNDYVLELFTQKLGLYHCAQVSDHLRRNSQFPWFKNTLFVFTKQQSYKGFECK
jgi:hypothetical protein